MNLAVVAALLVGHFFSVHAIVAGLIAGLMWNFRFVAIIGGLLGMVLLFVTNPAIMVIYENRSGGSLALFWTALMAAAVSAAIWAKGIQAVRFKIFRRKSVS